jgi:hypothetical protein
VTRDWWFATTVKNSVVFLFQLSSLSAFFGALRVVALSGTGTLACAGFAALNVAAQPRMAVLLDFFRGLFSRDSRNSENGLQPLQITSQLFPMRVDGGQFLLLALVFIASAPAFFVELSAHGCFLLIGAVDPSVDPGRPGFHARDF